MPKRKWPPRNSKATIDNGQHQQQKTQADYDALFAHYRQHDLPKQGEALSKIRGWIDHSERVALTCYEAQPCQCHRQCVAESLERMGGATMRAHHL